MNWSLIEPKIGYFITSDNPVVRRVDPKTVSPIYGDNGFLNNTVDVTFPLTPKLMLVAAWHENLPQQGICGKDHVVAGNANRALYSERYLYAHIFDKRIKRLAAQFKHSRPSMTTKGFGPAKFAKAEVPRRWSK